MKKLTRLLAALLALMLALSCAALGEAQQEDSAADDPVLLTLDGNEYRRSTVDAYIESLMYYGYLSSADEYDLAIQYIVENKVINDKIAEWGLDQYTDEENDAFRAEALAMYEPDHDSILLLGAHVVPCKNFLGTGAVSQICHMILSQAVSLYIFFAFSSVILITSSSEIPFI